IFSVRQRRALPLYGPAETLASIRTSFKYIFDDSVRAYEGTSKPALELRPIDPGRPFTVGGTQVLPLAVHHGHPPVFGYRLGSLAYITDAKDIPDSARACLQGLKVLALNALWWRPHPTHLSISEAIQVARDLAAERTFLTHLTHETGHAELAAQLPP